jgi:nucleoid DNA-binding protein
MTRAELIEYLGDQFEASAPPGKEHHLEAARKFMKFAIHVALPEIARRLVTGEKVVLQEFGTFTVERAKARARFDFAAGAPVKKPERFFIKFTPCKELASEVQLAHLKRAKKR